jgi:glycosyltransferase involved in cell wall biosynthesis
MPPTVAYVYEHDAEDPTVQSGRPRAILQEIRGRGLDVVEVFPLDRRIEYQFLWKKLFYRAGGKIYRTDREPAVLRSLSAQAARRLQDTRVDCVFAPGSHAVALLDISVPKVFCADATFRNVLDLYDDFSDCAAEYVRQGDVQERLALRTSAAAIYPSRWAADSAVRHFGAEAEKVHVVPFGANVDPPAIDQVRTAMAAKHNPPLRVLFIGREWRRKGLPKVIESCRWVIAQGTEVQLDVVGGEGYDGPRPSFARFHGFLNKAVAAQRALLERLLAEAHFLMVLSTAENYGMVFCEAAAYGLPVVSTDVGGITTIVREGVTGFCRPADAPPEAFAALMLELFCDRARYEAMAMQGRADYEARLNWRAFGSRLVEILHSCVERGGQPHSREDPAETAMLTTRRRQPRSSLR